MIKKFRKKPVVIEAIQYTGDNTSEIKEFCGDMCLLGHKPLTVAINTLEGVMTASKGDYVIKGVNGEFYPCKPDIFEKTYEEVN